MSTPFIAQFPGTCATCSNRVREGEMINKVSLGYAHVDCEDPDLTGTLFAEWDATRPDEPDPLAVTSAVCPRCFIAHAGECF